MKNQLTRLIQADYAIRGIVASALDIPSGRLTFPIVSRMAMVGHTSTGWSSIARTWCCSKRMSSHPKRWGARLSIDMLHHNLTRAHFAKHPASQPSPSPQSDPSTLFSSKCCSNHDILSHFKTKEQGSRKVDGLFYAHQTSLERT